MDRTDYSSRNTCIGSTRAARSAGKSDAAAATEAKIIPLRCLKCRIAGLEEFIPHDTTFPMDCFAVEGLKVFLDKIRAARKE
jgi:hypothetical protein